MPRFVSASMISATQAPCFSDSELVPINALSTFSVSRMERPLIATTQWYPFLTIPEQNRLNRGAGLKLPGDLVIIGNHRDVLSVTNIARDMCVVVPVSSTIISPSSTSAAALADPFFRAEIDNFAGVRCLFEARSGTKNGSAMRSGQQPLLFQLAEIGTNGSARYIKDVTHLRNSNFAFSLRIPSNFSCLSSANILPLSFTARYARRGAGLPLRISRVLR